jgi:hypothetical protein
MARETASQVANVLDKLLIRTKCRNQRGLVKTLRTEVWFRLGQLVRTANVIAVVIRYYEQTACGCSVLRRNDMTF